MPTTRQAEAKADPGPGGPESALQDRERQLNQLIGNLPGFVYRAVQVRGRWTLGYMSEGCRSIIGYGPEDFTGDHPMSWNQLIPLSHRDSNKARWEKALGDGSVFEAEYPVTCASGESRWLWERGSAIYDEAGRIRFVEGFVTDITRRKGVEEALRASEARNRALIAAIPDLIFTFNRGGEYLAVYASDPGLLYAPEAMLLHRRVAEILPAPLAGRFMAAIAATLDQTGVQELNYSMSIAGGEKYFEARMAPSAKDIVIAIIRDVTERKHTERQQRQLQIQVNQARKMESLGCLAGGIAHDMNNVLGAILALASANSEIQPAGSPAQRAFRTIVKAAERGGTMLKGLLNFARQAPAEERELDLNLLLQEEVHLLERTTLAKVQLVLDLAPDLAAMRGDASALSHSFMNLCINAVDAMPANGTLSLRTRNAANGWIEVEVADTGCGMPPEVLENALNPFFTTKPVGRGTGLGLAIVYNTVKTHKGHMEIQSVPGQGTCVRIRFPAAVTGTRATGPGPGSAPSGPPHRSLRVLVVDDDELIRSAMLELLLCLGHAGSAVAGGEEALLHLRAHPADVVVLDMNMPGWGGAETLPRIRAVLPAVPVLLATGRADQAVLNLLAAHAGVTLLAKPFSMKELQQQLGRIAAQGPGAG